VPAGRSAADELANLRLQFPAFRIYRQATPGSHARYVAQRISREAHPHTVITADPDELRLELSRAS
jgi:hypothetical protein